MGAVILILLLLVLTLLIGPICLQALLGLLGVNISLFTAILAWILLEAVVGLLKR